MKDVHISLLSLFGVQRGGSVKRGRKEKRKIKHVEKETNLSRSVQILACENTWIQEMTSYETQLGMLSYQTTTR